MDDTYKNEFIESRKNGNLSVVLDVIGKENFEALNDLFYEFSLFRIYQYLDAGKETEETIKFNEICSKRNEILN